MKSYFNIVLVICLLILMYIILFDIEKFNNLKLIVNDNDRIGLNKMCIKYNLKPGYSPFDQSIKYKEDSKIKNELEQECKKIMTPIEIMKKLRRYDNSKCSKEYNRSFFKVWDDVNNDDCDTRSEVLARDSLDNIEYNNWVISTPCKISKGKWQLPIEDNRIETSADILEVDHHVPLKHAWDMGACHWSDDKKILFGNDMTPGHLKVISKTMNTSKGARSIDKFNPSIYINKFNNKLHRNIKDNINNTKKHIHLDDCQYAADWLAIKHRYNLLISDNEINTINQMFQHTGCQNIYPLYPVYKNDELGKSLIEENIITKELPLLTQTQIKKRENIQASIGGEINSCFLQDENNIKNIILENTDSFGIHNKNHIDTLDKDQLCKIIFS